MPDKEISELRRWSAEELMGWEPHSLTENEYPSGHWYHCKEKGYIVRQEDWRPDDPTTSQIWLIIEEMGKKGWYIRGLSYNPFIKKYTALFWKGSDNGDLIGIKDDIIHCLAILKAAREAIEKIEEPCSHT